MNPSQVSRWESDESNIEFSSSRLSRHGRFSLKIFSCLRLREEEPEESTLTNCHPSLKYSSNSSSLITIWGSSSCCRIRRISFSNSSISSSRVSFLPTSLSFATLTSIKPISSKLLARLFKASILTSLDYYAPLSYWLRDKIHISRMNSAIKRNSVSIILANAMFLHDEDVPPGL